jgi:hypothetical protein
VEVGSKSEVGAKMGVLRAEVHWGFQGRGTETEWGLYQAESDEVEVGSEVEGRSRWKVVLGQRQDDSGDRQGRQQCGTPEGSFRYSGSPDRGRDCMDMTGLLNWAS